MNSKKVKSELVYFKKKKKKKKNDYYQFRKWYLKIMAVGTFDKKNTYELYQVGA
jgi:hypothetical protein